MKVWSHWNPLNVRVILKTKKSSDSSKFTQSTIAKSNVCQEILKKCAIVFNTTSSAIRTLEFAWPTGLTSIAISNCKTTIEKLNLRSRFCCVPACQHATWSATAFSSKNRDCREKSKFTNLLENYYLTFFSPDLKIRRTFRSSLPTKFSIQCVAKCDSPRSTSWAMLAGFSVFLLAFLFFRFLKFSTFSLCELSQIFAMTKKFLSTISYLSNPRKLGCKNQKLHFGSEKLCFFFKIEIFNAKFV